MNTDKTYPRDMWWHHHPVFEISGKGTSVPRVGREQEYWNVWWYRERSAWTYELVRRLAQLIAMFEGKPPDGLPIPSVSILAMLQGLLPYYKLAPEMQESIAHGINFSLGVRPTTICPADLPGAVKGYGILPYIALDLKAGNTPLVEWFLNQVDLLRVRSGIERQRQAKHVTKNKDKAKHKCRWDHLDFVHNSKHYRCPDSNEPRCCNNLLRTAITHVDDVAKAIIHCCWRERPGTVGDLRFGLSGRESPEFRVKRKEWTPGKRAFPIAYMLAELSRT